MSQVTWSGEDCDRTQEQETQQCHRLPGQVETDMTQGQETHQCHRLPGQVKTVIGHKNRRPSNVTGHLVRWRLC